MITRNFILGGTAIFTVSNGQGQHYTFRVDHSEGDQRFAPAWFIKMLTGPDNTSDYTYMGKIDAEMGEVVITTKSKFAAGSQAVKVAGFVLRVVWGRQELPAGYEIMHNGCCARCGRMLTVPESVESGFGPECIKKMVCV